MCVSKTTVLGTIAPIATIDTAPVTISVAERALLLPPKLTPHYAITPATTPQLH